MEKIVIGEKIMKSFGNGSEQVKVLDGVSVQIGEGEFVAIMGPSGSGKSTLLFALSGMDGVDGGRVVFTGRNLSTLKEQELSDLRRTSMGFVFQQPTLLKNLNLLDNIMLPSMRDNRKHAAQIAEKAKGLMKRAGIAELEKRDVTQASGGQLQRVGICRALMCDPKIIFGDEPTGALNSKAAQEIMDMLTAINEEGTAILLVTHDAKVAARAERILFMRDGNIRDERRLAKYTGTGIEDRVELVAATMRDYEI
ncbi:ABC transporter ATP-binding protein [Gorillibacterium sp. CAU 1737]|uniref:ABC transporter ATP-binding protein n=1 Tax=Gorillibacterium sp. CAU 1737 TaxID=3140362 RepID=UPI0032612671